MVGKSSDIVVALYYRRFACARFDNVGVNSSLNEEIDGAYFLCLGLENTDKFFADNFPFCFGIGNSVKFRKKTVRGVDLNEF